MSKAQGHRGSWFATVDGESLPCVHREWYNVKKGANPYYLDPGAKLDQGKWVEFINAISEKKRVVLTKDKFLENSNFQRQGYIAVFEIDNVVVDERGLYFDFIKRLDEAR